MNKTGLTRRTTVATSVATVAAAFGTGTGATAQPQMPKGINRIAFGSCAHQDKDQPIWDHVVAAQPDLFIFLGDNIYGDTRDMSVMRAKYAQLAAKPGFQKLRDSTPIVATWDDHDYGEDDAGADYPMGRESKEVFLEFFREPPGSERWRRDGLYTSYLFGPAGQRTQVILPDLRMHRSAIRKLDLSGKDYKTWAKELDAAGRPVPGPYERNPDPKASMLGDAQWSWLEQQLRIPADLRIIGSSLQVLADFPGWEAWINYAHDHQRLIEIIRKTKASGVIFLSGDTHYGEISKLDLNVPYPLWDVTSSGITEVWPVLPPNDNRVGQAVREPNFGFIEINWAREKTTVKLQVRGGDGQVRINQGIQLSDLAESR